MKKQLILMSGVMGSGKSHYAYARTRLDSFNERVVSRDEIRFSLLKDDEDYFAHEKQVYRRFVQQVQDYLNDNETAVIWADATFLTDKARKRFLDELELNNDVKVKLIIMDTTLCTCLKRNEKRLGRSQAPEEKIIEAWEKFERVTGIEKIDEVEIAWGEK